MPPVSLLKSMSVSHIIEAALRLGTETPADTSDRDSAMMDAQGSNDEATAMDIETDSKVETDSETEEELLALDYNSLVRSCVQGAAGMLRDQFEPARTIQRIPILLDLLSQSAIDGNSSYFCQTAKKRPQDSGSVQW